MSSRPIARPRTKSYSRTSHFRPLTFRSTQFRRSRFRPRWPSLPTSGSLPETSRSTPRLFPPFPSSRATRARSPKRQNASFRFDSSSPSSWTRDWCFCRTRTRRRPRARKRARFLRPPDPPRPCFLSVSFFLREQCALAKGV